MPSSPSTGVYNPKAFILHAASLGQACAHCRRFSTAASRRSLGSVSVPVCRAMLAHPVGIAGLVGRHPANYLIPRRPVPRRPKPLAEARCRASASPGITRGFPRLCPSAGLVTVALLTLAPLALRPVRLACLIHAANVHSEPGSNPSRWGSGTNPTPISSGRGKTNWSPRGIVAREMNPGPDPRRCVIRPMMRPGRNP